VFVLCFREFRGFRQHFVGLCLEKVQNSSNNTTGSEATYYFGGRQPWIIRPEAISFFSPLKFKHREFKHGTLSDRTAVQDRTSA